MYITDYEVKRDKQKADTYKRMKKGRYKKIMNIEMYMSMDLKI